MFLRHSDSVTTPTSNGIANDLAESKQPQRAPFLGRKTPKMGHPDYVDSFIQYLAALRPEGQWHEGYIKTLIRIKVLTQWLR